MEARLLIAYLLIGLGAAAFAILIRSLLEKRREHRRMMRGHRIYKRRRPDRQ